MKMLLTHHFPCSPEEFWAVVMDPVFSKETDQKARIEKTVLESRIEPDGRRYQHMRFFYLDPLPAIVARILGTGHLTYEQIQRIDDRALTLEWEVIPPISRKKFRADGFYRVRAAKGGCERVIEGDVEVKVPLVGRKIEQGVIDQIKNGYERGADIIRQRLQEG